MSFVVRDRVKETTTTTGTGTLTLAGAVSGFRSFADIGNANTCPYVILEASESAPTQWEVGIGTYTSSGTTLSRDTVLRTSAGNTTKITLASGTHTVFCGFPADYGLEVYNQGHPNTTTVINSSSQQTLTNNGFSKITSTTFATKSGDPLGWWDNANAKYVPLRAGIYLVFAWLEFTSLNDTQAAAVNVYLNGSNAVSGTLLTVSGAGSWVTPTVSGLVACNGSTDYIEIYGYLGSGANSSLHNGTAANGVVITYIAPSGT